MQIKYAPASILITLERLTHYFLFAQVSSIEESEVGELKKCVTLFSKPNITI